MRPVKSIALLFSFLQLWLMEQACRTLHLDFCQPLFKMCCVLCGDTSKKLGNNFCFKSGLYLIVLKRVKKNTYRSCNFVR